MCDLIASAILALTYNTVSGEYMKNIRRIGDIAVGDKIGNVQITSLIAQGGMGAIFKGYHLTLDIDVAVKVISNLIASESQQMFDFFQSEAKILAKLRHPNIVRILDFSIEHEPAYIIQEYVEGQSLHEYLSKLGPLDSQEAIRIMLEVALALEDAHRLGLVHRDIKPRNIMVCHDSTIKLLDFGIATQVEEDANLKDKIVGTANYIAPEQAGLVDEPVDGRADIYALGITFYELLAGKCPFSDCKGMHNLVKRATIGIDLKPLSSIDETVLSIISTMTEIKPGKRYQKISQLIEALRLVYDPMLGLEINGYRIIRLIGRGGQGKVYLATNSSQQVAIKVLPIDEAIKPEAKERFRIEGKIAKYLNHPNIVKVFDYGEAILHINGSNKTINFIIMDFISGADIENLITSKGKPNFIDGVKIVSDVLDALSYAHQQDLIHRDVKAKNVLISNNGEVKLTDFGLCKYNAKYNPQTSFSFATVTGKGSIFGSPHWMSPEHIKGEKLDYRTDIYSCGVLLFYLCTHQLPFDGDMETTIMISIISKLTPDPRSFNNEIPKELANIIMKMMAKDRDHRFTSCAEVRNNLNIFIEQPIKQTSIIERFKQYISTLFITNKTADIERKESLFSKVGNQKTISTVQIVKPSD